jgi:NADH dehydrogenase
MSASSTGRHHAVIVGCGFGGLSAAKALRRADVDVTVINRTSHHLIQPLLCQVATGVLSEGNIATPIGDILRDQRNARLVLGEVVGIALDARRVTVESYGQRHQIAYDSLIVAAGASQSYFGHPEFARDAPGVKTIDQALELRSRILGAFKMAERETDPVAQRRLLTFVVVDAGPTGVELAGQLVEFSRRSMRRDVRRIDPIESRVVLLGAAPTVLPAFPERLRERAARDLRAIGVEVHVGTVVTGVDEQGINTNSIDSQVRRIDAATKIWAAGVQASPLGAILAEESGAELDRVGRVKVEADCTLPGHPEVFIIGDLMSLENLPGVTQVAIQSGRHAAHAIIRRLAGDNTRQRFRYNDSGTIAIISRLRAVAMVGPLRVSGLPAWVLWIVVKLATLVGFKNRMSVMYKWAAAFLGRPRAQRVITQQQVFAGDALEVPTMSQRNFKA